METTDLQTTERAAPAPAGGLGGALVPQSLDELQRFAETVANSRMVPKPYRGKPQDVVVTVMHGLEIGMKPLQALQNIALINGKPSVYGDGAIALVRRSPACEYVNEWTEHDDQHGLTAYAETKRKGEPTPSQRAFSKQDAQEAGLWGRKGPWSDYPRRMLQMRARSWLLRDVYADVLQGLYIAEEAEAIPADQGETIDPRGEMSQSQPSQNGQSRNGRAQKQRRQQPRSDDLTIDEKLQKATTYLGRAADSGDPFAFGLESDDDVFGSGILSGDAAADRVFGRRR